MDKFELKKEYKKSKVYENANYKVKIKNGKYGVTPKAYYCEDDELRTQFKEIWDKIG